MGDAPRAAADWARAKELDPTLTDDRRAVIPNPPKPPERKKLGAGDAEARTAALARAEPARTRKQYPEAEAALTEALRIDPTSGQAHALRARLLGAVGRHDAAAAGAEAALRLDPDNALAYLTRGVVKRRKDDPAGAIADYTIALRIEPTNHLAYSNRGWAYHGRKQYHQALADLNEGIRLNPQCGGSYSNRGGCYLYLGEYEKALADYLKAADADPSEPQWRRLCAALHARLGRPEDARTQRDLAARLKPELKDAPDVQLPVPLPPVKTDRE